MSTARRLLDASTTVTKAVEHAKTLLHRPTSGDAESDPMRWRAVTINGTPEQVAPAGVLPLPLAALGQSVEVRLTQAPGGKGTELAVRFRGTSEPSGVTGALRHLDDDDPRQRLRSALRESKQLVEVGEVLRVDPAPHGHRPATPAGKIIDAVTRRAGAEGVL